MISVTIDSVACRLLTCAPNTAAAVRLEVEMPAQEARSLTGYAARRSTDVLPRFAQSWHTLLEAADFAALRDASLAMQDEPILAPVWRQAWRPATESPTLTGGLIVAWTEGFATWAINPGSYAAYDYAAPLIYGRFGSPPRLVSVSGALVQAQLEVEEDAPATYALSVPGGILAADTLDAGFPVFPFASLADWSSPPSPGLGVTDVERLATGPGRMQASIFYPQVPERVFSARFAGVGRTEAAQLIAWWIRRGGAAEAHRVDLAALGVLSGGNVLARHTNRRLVLDAVGPLSTCELAWRESSSEASVPAGETAGVTVGRVPAEAWFFEIALDFNGATQTWRLTNWQSGAAGVGGHDWAYNACDFDGLTQSIDLEDDACSCTFRYFPGGPWDHWLPGRLAARGTLTLYRANASSEGSFSGFAQVWQGELRQPDLDGPIVRWQAAANAVFARMAPRQLMSTACGTMLFRPRCGLALADWTFHAVVASSSGVSITVGTITRANGGGLPSGFGAEGWFALGWLQWTVSGTPRRLSIVASAALSGGQIVLTLDRAPGLANGTAVSLAPGCDRLRESGCAKFANTDNFRGFDQMPAISPSFVLPQRHYLPAKK